MKNSVRRGVAPLSTPRLGARQETDRDKYDITAVCEGDIDALGIRSAVFVRPSLRGSKSAISFGSDTLDIVYTKAREMQV